MPAEAVQVTETLGLLLAGTATLVGAARVPVTAVALPLPKACQ
ncbi:hypothetical protein AHiyo6_05020 [Arthrobacter sp. Hiyo6]|nr:hypothetical protein AHiyo6_05020 [Arthrobacter sp. Hiyo6]